jgi:NAD dependent epimerase/dehydratase
MAIDGNRVLVTGADGFIGSHLTEMLAAQGARIRALCLYNSFNDWGWLEGLSCLDRIEVMTGDVRDPHFARAAVKGCRTVFHLAALIAIPYSYTAPDSYVQTNITGTLNLLQAAREHGVARFIHTSTSEVYGTARTVPIDETHPLQAQSPYSASKIGADAIAQSFFSAFSLPVTIARPFNTYGPRQSARAVIPTIITQIAAGKRSICLGSLHPTRDFNYVEDTCRGFVALANCEAAVGRTVNIGSNSEISIGDLACLIKELMGSQIKLESDQARIRPQGSEVERLVCDSMLIRNLTGYVPQIGLRAGLSRTIDWFSRQENLRHYKSAMYNL